MRTTKLASLALLALLSVGCANARGTLGAASTSLDLERVVLYRNGIGYFERHGEVDDSILRIRVRRDQINDLLKSLTVVDEDGQAVSVSMPLDPETWAAAALSALAPGRGSLAGLLDGLRGTEVSLHTTLGRVRGRVVLVERIVDEPDPDARNWPQRGSAAGGGGPSQRDYKVTLMRGTDLRVVRLSKVHDVTLHDGDLAMQLHRRLDASSGEGMFQQVEVAIRLVGAKSHDVRVSYVVSAPMWKPTYRVVLPEGGKGQALLQAWAVVDNTSGEDWSEVTLGLTSGEPIAFRYDLHTPRTVPRSDLTEAGVRKRAAVAMGETTYGTFGDEEELEEEAMDEAYYEDDDGELAAGDAGGGEGRFGAVAQAERSVRADKSKMKKEARNRGSAAPKPSSIAAPRDQTSAVDLDALRRSTLADARAKQVSGMTRYDLEEKVTVPNGSSTMVAILNRQVDAEQTFLYRPGGAGIGYDANPYRVVRFKNSTPFVLEPGPISIYSGNSFVGEGISEAVSTGTSATIPFAVEPSILVSSSSKYTGGEMHLLKISRGVLEVESFSRTTTTWSVKGKKADQPYRVLVRHAKAGWNYDLVDPPKDTEVLPDGYLIPVTVAKGRTEGSVEIVEQTPSQTTISIWDGRALELLETLVLSTDLTPDLRAKIQPIVDLRREIGRIDTEIEGLKKQQVELDQRARETRQNLEAIKKDPAANALRKKLSNRLEEFTSDGDKIGRTIVERQSQRLEKKIALEDLLDGLELVTPKARAKKAAGKKK